MQRIMFATFTSMMKMATSSGMSVLAITRLTSCSFPSIARGNFVKITPLYCCRWFRSIRRKADQLKDGYEPRDRHLQGKTPEEVIQELLAQDAPRERPKTRAYYCREYALKGKASGVDPAIMWPTKKELKQLIEDENYYCRSLEFMQEELYLEKKRKELEELRKQKHIEKCLAELPKLEEEHRKKEEEKRLKEAESQKKKAALLEVAREKLGYAIDPRSQRFKEMVEEMEKEEKKQKKALKKRGIVT